MAREERERVPERVLWCVERRLVALALEHEPRPVAPSGWQPPGSAAGEIERAEIGACTCGADDDRRHRLAQRVALAQPRQGRRAQAHRRPSVDDDRDPRRLVDDTVANDELVFAPAVDSRADANQSIAPIGSPGSYGRSPITRFPCAAAAPVDRRTGVPSRRGGASGKGAAREQTRLLPLPVGRRDELEAALADRLEGVVAGEPLVSAEYETLSRSRCPRTGRKSRSMSAGTT